jgi:hypothetical protein
MTPTKPLPPAVAQKLLSYKKGLPTPLWHIFCQDFTKARKSFAPERALELAEQALLSKLN